MKNWEKPVIEELDVAETQYGGDKAIKFDNIYENTKPEYEGTFWPAS